jgi:membrane protease subunit (stomatin/prohibitin family)
MEIKIQGKRNSKFNVPTNAIMMKRKQKSTQKQIVINGNINVKFCFNCGTKNDSFQFCPNCGTKF